MKRTMIIALGLILLVGSYHRIFRPYVATLLRYLPLSSETIGPPKRALWAAEMKEYCRIHPVFPEVVRKQSAFPLDEQSTTMPIQATHMVEVRDPPAYIVELENGRVYGRKGIVITKEDVLLKDNAVEAFVVGKYPTMGKTHFPKSSYLDQVVAVITVDGYWNYHHWLMEVLPKIHLLHQSGIPYDKLYLGCSRSSFHLDSLRLLGIPEEKLMIAETHTHIKAKKVLVPIVERYSLHKELFLGMGWSIPFLQKHCATSKIAPPQRLYLSRSQIGRRTLSNEEELCALLKKYGFVRIHPHEFSFEEQITLFSSAEIIIGYHGAAFTNLIFCPPHTKVIELFHPKKQTNCYWNMAQVCGLEYYAALTIPSDENTYVSAVDLDALTRFLDTLE